MVRRVLEFWVRTRHPRQGFFLSSSPGYLWDYLNPMRILHTADWHLGQRFISGHERTDKHRHFLHWLVETVREQALNLHARLENVKFDI